MTKTTTPDDLASEAAALLGRYVHAGRRDTELLRQIAPLIVELRSNFTLEDGRPDWSGRSPEYRALIARVYKDAKVPADHLDTVQAALRYHVGNLLREKASREELASVGLGVISPRERLAKTRQAFAAMVRASGNAPREDVARTATYAQALLEYVDDHAVGKLTPEQAIAATLALRAARRRADELLRMLEQEETPAQKKTRRRRREADPEPQSV